MIIQGQCNEFLLNKLKGAEDFSLISPYLYHIALYVATATLNKNTLSYTTVHEVVGTGYTAGGKLLTPIPPALVSYPASSVAYISFQNPTWTGADFLARGALIYNFTTLAAVAVLDFGTDIHFLGTKTLTFPPATPTTAVIRDTIP
jgi:hypothetical protein